MNPPADAVDLTVQLTPSLALADHPDAESPQDDAARDPSGKLADLDRHTSAFLRMVQGALGDWKANLPTASDVRPPSREGVLPTIPLPFGGLSLPSLDEDWPEQGLVRAAALRALRSRLFPLADHDDRWESRAQARAAFQEVLPVGALLPEPHHHWDEMGSDEATSRLAFAGLGALRLLPVEEADPDDAVWVSDLAFLSGLDVRPGFERYGAIAYFDASQAPVRIHWCHARRDVRPGDPDWEHAKWAWRCSLLVGTTVADHLVGVHWLIGNYVTMASRSHLSTDHPLRCLLKPFTWRTVTINYNATFSLCPEWGFVHRATAFTYPALLQGLEDSVGLLRYRTVPELVARKRAGGLGDAFPWATDALALYDVVHAFVDDYLSRYFAGDAAIRDPQIRAFWAQVRSASASVGIPELTRTNLVELLAQFVWCVTGLHEAVGAVLEYVIDPTYLGTKIRPGTEMADVQASLQCLLVIGLTGLEMPRLLGDYSHVCRDAAGRESFAAFQRELRALSERIDEANRRRRWPCNVFNPRVLKTGVSI